MNPTPIPAEGMKTTAHTPGTWYADPNGCVYVDTPKGCLRIADCVPAEEDENLIPEGQEEANAALCALAPAMKDALQAFFDACGPKGMDPLKTEQAFAKARHILSKLNQRKTP